MKFALIYEIALPIEVEATGKTEAEAYWEALDQIKLADEVGFDYVWVVEHHFLEDLSRSSAPEIFLSAVAQHTKRIRIGHGVVLMPPPFSHPFRIAERIGTLDILSRGRVEFGCGRSVTTAELEGYGVPPDDARAMMEEAMRVVPQMWRQREFPGYKGRFMNLPPRVVVPKPIQKPHPPMWMACSSSTSFKAAGEMGVGCLSFTTSTPPELKVRNDRYREGLKNCKPIGDFVNAQVAGFTTLYVEEDDKAARAWGGINAVTHMTRINRYFGNITQYAGYSEYSAALQERAALATEDFDPVARADQYIGEARMCVGSPDTCADIIRRYEEIGIDQFLGLVQYSKITHEQSMRTIRLMGEKVIPRFRKGRAA